MKDYVIFIEESRGAEYLHNFYKGAREKVL